MQRRRARALAAGAPMALAATALLSACGGEGREAQAGKTASISPSSAYVDRLRSLSEANRGLALRRAVQDSRQSCKKAETSGYQQDYKNMSMWSLRCTDGRSYALFIAPNGDVQVRRCEHLAQLGLPTCRFDEQKKS